MGRKRTRKGKHLLLHIACFLTVAFSLQACNHLPMAWQGRQQLKTANSLMAQGDFAAALKEAETVLRSHPQAMGDEALYLMGVIYAHPKNPSFSWKRSCESFQILIKRYPESRLVQESEVWVSMLRKLGHMDGEITQLRDSITNKEREIGELRTQIDKLKKIDLGIEEKKRRNLPH